MGGKEVGMKACAVLLAACLLAAFAGPSEAAEPSWLTGPAAGRAFEDLSRLPTQSWPGDAVALVALDSPVRFRGALYDHLVLGPTPGTALLTSGEVDPFGSPEGLVIAPIAIPLNAGPGSLVQ